MLAAALLCSLVDVQGTGTGTGTGTGMGMVQPGFVSCGWAQTSPSAPSSTDSTDAARQHFERGAEFFKQGNYLQARIEFEVAYALSKQPLLLYNLGKTAEKLNQTEEAIRFYDGYLLTDPPEADAVEIRAKITELDKRRAAEKANAAATTQAPATVTPSTESKLPPTGALALLGAGAGLLIIGIGCGGGALADANTVKSAGTAQPPVLYSTVAGAASRGPTLNGVGAAFDVLGVLALGAGGAWTGYWFYQKSKDSKQSARAVSLAPFQLGASLAGQF